jgi:hypothetical protein
VDVELLVVPECPHQPGMAALLRTALDDIGLSGLEYTVHVVADQDDADSHQFSGSPTVAVNGRDLFPIPGQAPALSCRLYAGPGGLPELRDLRQALKAAAARALSG